MKSRRLTKELQYKIKARAEDWKFEKEQELLKVSKTKLADDLFVHFYPDKVQAMMAKLPDFMIQHDDATGFFVTNSACLACVKIVKFEVNRWYQSTHLYFTDETKRKMLGRSIDTDDLENLKKSNYRLYGRFVKVVAHVVMLSTRKEKFRTKLQYLMDQVTTTKKLIDVLPEAQEWMPEVFECNNLPAADTVAGLLNI